MKGVRYCSLCFNHLNEQDILLNGYFCNQCYSQFEFISTYRGQKCLNCEKKINRADKQMLCEDCQYWQNHVQLPLVRNKALLYYNQFAHEVMEKAKFSGDVEIWRGFVQMLHLKRLLPRKNVQIVPSSTETYLHRDYDHLKAMAKMLNVKTVDYVQKKEGVVSQVVLKTVSERKRLKNAFVVLSSENCKSLTVFDDVYTTGTTLKDLQGVLDEQRISVLQTVTIFRADLQF